MFPNSLRELLGEQVQDAYEETFSLFSENLPSNNLGFVDSKANDIEMDIGGRSVLLKQSPGLLLSQRPAGTTGAVLWKVTPLIASWLASKPRVLYSILSAEATVVEVGCGISGLIGILLAPLINTYILTDQAYVSKKVHENIAANTPTTRRGSKAANIPRFVDLDWETTVPSKVGLSLNDDTNINLIIACDCIYNEHLIQPLVNTMAEMCRLRGEDGRRTVILVAQQLRSEEIFEGFMAVLLEDFEVWRMPESELSESLRSGSGYAVHIGWLRDSSSLPK